MKKTVYLVIATFSLLFSTGYGQITITGNEHVFNNYSESFGKNVTFSLNDDDVNNIFVFKDDKMKNVSKIFDKIEINGFIKGSKTWVVHGITTHKKKNYLHISQNNNNLYLWVDKTDYVNKMQNISIYDNYIDMLNENNIYLKKCASPIDLSSKYLLCDTACHIKWTGYELINDTIYFFYSFIDKNKSSSDTYSISASTITQDKFVNIRFIDECLLLEQNFKDSLEDEKLHAFLISQKMQGDVDTVFLFKPVQGWHHNSIRTVISTNTNDITLYAPDSTYSQMSYTEYLDYVTRRGHKGEMLRMDLAKYADSVNSIGFVLHMQQLQKKMEREKELEKSNNPLLAKPRVNDVERKFLAKSAIVTNIKEWFYDNDSGKWINPKHRQGDGHCKSLQLCSFGNSGETYYALRIATAGGEYEYPHLQLVFIPYDEYYLYVYDHTGVSLLQNPNEIACWVDSWEKYHYNNYWEFHTDNMIVRDLKHTYYSHDGYIWVQKCGNHIRFYDNAGYGSRDGHFNSRNIEREVGLHYYEIPISEWRRLFSIVK